MAHEISIQDGVAEAFFAKQPAWHGLGTQVENLQNAHDALTLAHLDWTVSKEHIFRSDGSKIPDKMCTVRDDTKAYLGTVGNDWEIFQNREQAKFIDALIGEGGAVVECAGALRGGKRTFWTCKLPGEIKVSDRDVINKYLIMCNGHDGSLAHRGFWSPIRMVCSNTLNASLGSKDAKDGFCFYHSAQCTVAERIREAKMALGLATEYYDKLAEQFKQMLAVSIGESEFKAYLDDVFPIKLDDKGEAAGAQKLIEKTRNQVECNFHAGAGSDMAGSTAFGAYNAVTEFVSHQRTKIGKTPETYSDRKFNNVFFGAGKEVQQKAFNAAMELVSA